MSRGIRTNNQPSAHQPEGPGDNTNNQKKSRIGKNFNWERILFVGFSAAVIIVVVAVVFSFFFQNTKAESQYVDKNKYQAVFLNGGQVYFGKINDLAGKHMKMSNIYYLRVNQQVQPDQQNNTANDVSLVKLGCELHGPQDEMVINREQIIFWENLKDDGQVVKAIAEYVKQNPQGQKCEQPSSNNNSSNNTSNTNTTNNNSNTTNRTNTGTTNTGNTNTNNTTNTTNTNR